MSEKGNFNNIQNISISGIVTLNLHSLNNEGSEGNTTETRMVQVVDKKGNLHSVNAISGDMFKHIQYEYLVNLSKGNLPLCSGCSLVDPNRINIDKEFGEKHKDEANDVDLISEVIKHCAGDDLEGVMITSLAGKKKSLARKSVIEFSWVVGIPDQVRTESYFHVKFDKAKKGKGSGDETGANVGQNIFHKPASSGRYSTVVTLDFKRIGLNDINLTNVLDENDIKLRKKFLLESVLSTFLSPNGANRNTQNPHVTNFEGIITISKNNFPAPMISALSSVGEESDNSDYREEIVKISENLNKLDEKSKAIDYFKFDSLTEFSDLISKIIKGM